MNKWVIHSPGIYRAHTVSQPLCQALQVRSAVMSPAFGVYNLQHTRLPCPSPSPRICPCSGPLNWYHPTISSSVTLFFCPVFPSIKVFSKESDFHIRWPKYWSFSFSISPSKEYSRLIFFRVDWFNFIALPGTFKSLFQHHSWRVSILLYSAFFIFQLSLVHMYSLSEYKNIKLLLYVVN